MWKNISLGMGATLAFAMSVYAQNYKINKVGSDEEKSFDVMLDQAVVSEAPAGSWLNIAPNVPNGKVFVGFTVYDEYGDAREQRKVSTTEKNENQFLMPNHDVYVSASFESLRYYLYVKNTDNGTVSLAFSDRYRDRTKPGVKVTVNPNAANGFKLASILVSKNLDASTVVPCTRVEPGTPIPGMWGMGGNAVEGSCSFDMPEFDVEVTATFVDEHVDLSSSSEEISYSSSSSSEGVAQSSSEEISSSSVESSTSLSSSSSDVASSSSSSVKQSSSSKKKSSSSSAKKTSSSSVKQSSSSSSNVSSSSAKKTSSSSVKQSSSSSKKVSSSSVKKTSSSSTKQASSSSKKSTSSSSKAKSSSSAKAKSSSSVIPDIVVEAVGTEEDMPSCTAKRENMTYYVTDLKTVFICKSRVWTKFNPGMGLEKVAPVAKFSALVNGRNLQISGAKIGSYINLLDMQGRVVYSSRVSVPNFSMQALRSGSYLLRVGAQQQVVNVR